MPVRFSFSLVQVLSLKFALMGMTAARNIMGDPYEFDWTDYPDFLHSTYEVSWVGLSEEEARQRYDNIVIIQMPPKGVPYGDIPLPCAEGTMLYAFMFP